MTGEMALEAGVGRGKRCASFEAGIGVARIKSAAEIKRVIHPIPPASRRVLIDERGERSNVGQGLMDFLVLLFEHHAEMFVEEYGDLQDVDRVESKPSAAVV